MLFRNKIEPCCAYCNWGRPGEDDAVICPHRGVMKPWSSCRRFRYDPLRRVPEAQPQAETDVDPDSFRL